MYMYIYIYIYYMNLFYLLSKYFLHETSSYDHIYIYIYIYKLYEFILLIVSFFGIPRGLNQATNNFYH